MMDIPEIINREAHDKSKGFRFQRLRAVSLMLDSMQETESPYIYCAIENIGDIHLHASSNENTDDYFEEDKDYDSSSAFSINSTQILKSIISFIDVWHKFELSPSLYFGFCTTANVAKEKYTKTLKDLGVTLPSIPILNILSNKEFIDFAYIQEIKKIIITAYKKEYSSHNSNGYFEFLTNWSNSTWQEFLNRITWFFGTDDENEIEAALVEKLKLCSFYTDLIRGKENLVISLLVDKFDKKQNQLDFADRFVHSSEIILVAKQIESGEYKLPDPAWQMWKELSEPIDTRNISDKVFAVSLNFNKKILNSWCRNVSLSRYEQESFKHDKSILSLKYRLFHFCYEKLSKTISKSKKFSNEELEDCVNNLVIEAVKYVEELSIDYKYGLGSTHSIKGIILELVDSCFLAFDDIGENN
jgi:hypothetical protein